ncbi:hypothetical protein F66182_6999 [Fusarium sp. NRRL 66182]|nr:hypothetical protein F66182_6999 [Fusarium sp. NRRL 66182]
MADLWKGPGFSDITAGKSDLNNASIAWGVSLGIGMFTCAKASQQTMRSWKRGRKMNPYIILVWTMWISNCVMTAITWCYLQNFISGGFPFFFALVFFWCVQLHALIQIIINRIAVLMDSGINARRLKIWAFFIILCINISIFTIWIPARLSVNTTWINVNNVWGRIEKVIFLVVDAGLNLYFIRLAQARLAANGLTKYHVLFRFNLGMIALSITLDILLIALMSLRNDIVYFQFHPLAYLIKLHVEMNMAELVTKILRASNSSATNDYSNSHSRSTQQQKSSQGQTAKGKQATAMFVGGNVTYIEAGGDGIELADRAEGGIQKTTRTEVLRQTRPSSSDNCDLASDTGSTRQLQKEHFPQMKGQHERRSSQIAILTAP